MTASQALLPRNEGCSLDVATTAIMPTILVVEDDPVILALWNELLEEEAYLVLLAASARQALQAAELGERRPELFILDFMLGAGMNGIHLYDRLCQSYGVKMLPALMVSATVPESDIAARGIIGVDKPFDIDQVLDLIRSLLNT